MLDAVIVTLVVGGAAAYLAWSFIPHRRRPVPPCAACAHSPEEKRSAPVRTPGSP